MFIDVMYLSVCPKGVIVLLGLKIVSDIKAIRVITYIGKGRSHGWR